MAKKDIYKHERFGRSTNSKNSEYNDQQGRYLAARIYSAMGHTEIYQTSDDQVIAGYGRPDLIVFTGWSSTDYMIVEVKCRKASDIIYSASPFVKVDKCNKLIKYANEFHPGKPVVSLYVYENDLGKQDVSDVYWLQFDIDSELKYQKKSMSVRNEISQQWQYIIEGHLSSPTTIFSKKFRF